MRSKKATKVRILESPDEYWVIHRGKYARAFKRELDLHGLGLQELKNAVSQTVSVVDHPKYHVTLAVTTRCDLECPYCFQQTLAGSGPPKRISARDLDESLLDAIERFVSARMADVGADQVDLLLYGGEPLLRPRACLDALRRFKLLGLDRCDMTTNGVNIRRQVFSELVDAGLTDVQLSLDGWSSAHDDTRSSKGGRPTYERIITNIESCRGLAVRWQFRVNMTPTNLMTLDRVIRDLAKVTDEGAAQVVLSPVLELRGVFNDAIQADATLAENVLALYEVAIRLGLRIPVPGDSRPCVDCGTSRGQTGAVIGPTGDLYSCWETIGRPSWNVGNVRTGYLNDAAELARRWVSCGTLTSDGDEVAHSDYENLVAIGRLNLLKKAGVLGANVAA